ncbi:MAG: hypothetical protein UH625_09695 [Muribaculaceae bacterium]|nr:hypothetical protein [Muribaculaceae bacterium]
MIEANKRKKGITQGIRALWRVWTLSNGSVLLLILLSPFLPNIYMPLIALAELGVIHFIIRRNRHLRAPFCYRIPYIFAWTVFWTAFVMVLYNLFLSSHFSTEWNGQPMNPDLPIIVVLIVAPVGFLYSLWYMIRGSKSSFCRDCEARSGMSEERGFLGKIYSEEADYQTKWLVVQWGALTVIDWIYYFSFYINTNINTPDMFMFVWLPMIVLLISVIYMGVRYVMLWSYYCNDENFDKADILGKSKIRFIVICDNKVWLNIPKPEDLDINPDNQLKIDTPVKLTVKFKTNITTFEASERFHTITGVKCPEIKKLYVNSDRRMVSNISHFAVFFDSPDALKGALVSGEWFTLAEIQMMHKAGLLASLFESEMYRIHTIAMAWKTYTKEGERRYAIKHYQPTFRLSDLPQWKVDFSDPTWLFVADNNQDKPFFRLRRLWRKYITGMGI